MKRRGIAAIDLVSLIAGLAGLSSCTYAALSDDSPRTRLTIGLVGLAAAMTAIWLAR
jgi:uncharacterized membrane protein YuzA (DUF378 family)